MNPADDDYSEYDDPLSGRTESAGGVGQTRTRLPESRVGDNVYGDVYGGARRPARSSRSLITVVGVVVLLIAAIAFANRGGGSGSEGAGGGTGTQAEPTAPTGERPVNGKNGAVPAGFAKTRQGAQSAAANYATVLGSDGMYNAGRRHGIVKTIVHPNSVDRLQTQYDAAYSKEFLAQVGLDQDGGAPSDSTFVSRTLPVGTKVMSYGSSGSATVEVWCNSLFGLTGSSSTKPVTSSWYTMTLKLGWADSDWKVLATSQKTGPTPVTGDNPVSGSDEIADAANEFGGFTYAR
jgi:hypothetical protein